MLGYNAIEGTLEEPRQGRTILITDDEDRGNEGDFTCVAELAITENANFVAVHGRGLICTLMSKTSCQKLQFPQMISDNKDNYEVVFTVFTDHTGTVTGIPVAERSITAMKYMRENIKPEDFRRPGHMFPLTTKKNGVLERNGHTEAAMGLMRLTGLKGCGLYYEVMREDETMTRTPELMELAKKWDLKMTITKALQEHHRRDNKLAEQIACASFPAEYGDFRTYGYINKLNGERHVTLVKEEISDGRNPLCRVHSECLAGDVFGFKRYDCGRQFAAVVAQIEKESRDTLLYMCQGGRGIGLINKLRVYALQDQRMDTLGANLALGFSGDLREYFIGAQVLYDLGAKTLRLFANGPDKVYQLPGFGMEAVQRVPTQMNVTVHDLFYLKVKQEKMSHLSNL